MASLDHALNLKIIVIDVAHFGVRDVLRVACCRTNSLTILRHSWGNLKDLLRVVALTHLQVLCNGSQLRVLDRVGRH